MNSVNLTGRLTKDPELRYTPSGVAVTRFTLAVNRSFSNGKGEKEADFINILVWRKPAENCANYLKKGSLAGVTGRIQTGSYEGQDGKRVFTTEVVGESVTFLEPKSNSNNTTSQNTQPSTYTNHGDRGPNSQYTQNYTRVDEDPFSSSGGPVNVNDDDLPF